MDKNYQLKEAENYLKQQIQEGHNSDEIIQNVQFYYGDDVLDELFQDESIDYELEANQLGNDFEDDEDDDFEEEDDDFEDDYDDFDLLNEDDTLDNKVNKINLKRDRKKAKLQSKNEKYKHENYKKVANKKYHKEMATKTKGVRKAYHKLRDKFNNADKYDKKLAKNQVKRDTKIAKAKGKAQINAAKASGDKAKIKAAKEKSKANVKATKTASKAKHFSALK